MTSSGDLERFVDAQASVYEQALAELRRGRKTSHWMWFVFPQVAGLGMSPMSQRFALAGLDEARAYLAHPVLGPRLRECSQAVEESTAASAQAIFGGIDAVKLRSSMTLFAHAAGDEAGDEDAVFRRVLARWFDGDEDPETLARI